MYVERNHFLKGLYSFDVEAAIEKKNKTDKKIRARQKKRTACCIIMCISVLLATCLFVGGFTWTLLELFSTKFTLSLHTIGVRAIWFLAVPIVLGIVAAVCEGIVDGLSRKPDDSFYTNAERYLITEKVDVVTSFVVYNEKNADLYLQYKVYHEDEDGLITETTDVAIIEDFTVKRTNKIDEPVLDVNNNIYYVPYGYVNQHVSESTRKIGL